MARRQREAVRFRLHPAVEGSPARIILLGGRVRNFFLRNPTVEQKLLFPTLFF